MSLFQYFVLLQKDQWVFTANGQHWGPYRSEDEAVGEAIRCARQSGEHAQVLVECANGQFRTEWTAGQDLGEPNG